jgi:hypothetical protein
MRRAAAVSAISFFSLPHKSLARQILRGGIFACSLFLAIVCVPSQTRAWGCKGHQVIALLAEKHLSPRALEMAKKILADSAIDPALDRYCKEGRIDSLADASTWPDDFRVGHPETGPWHYLDIPLGTTRRDVEKFCDPKEGCVTSAIRDDLAVLRSANSNPKDRADALRFLIHFVGDLHQPLHAATNNDQGGNCVPVAFFDVAPQLRNPQTESYAPNLHAVWDTNIFEKATIGKTVDQVASDLDASFSKKMVAWQKDPPNIDAWVWEGYKLAAKDVYGKLPVRIPVETPQAVKSCADDNQVGARNLKLNEHLGAPYQDMAAPIVEERVAEAGAHLALLLNQLWP